jgi:single-strand DNA-binding protein
MIDVATNVVALVGRLNRPAEERELPSGDRLLGLELTVDRPDDKAESVPVVWPAGPASALGWEPGELVVVVGRVRRRFFRAGGVTQSRTEVVAEQAAPARHNKRARAALDLALGRLDDLLDSA